MSRFERAVKSFKGQLSRKKAGGEEPMDSLRDEKQMEDVRDEDERRKRDRVEDGWKILKELEKNPFSDEALRRATKLVESL